MKAHSSVIAARFIAILLLVIPGLLATYGFLRMKDALYNYFVSYGDELNQPSFEWFTFVVGFILFVIGVSFIGGWIFFRDRKHNYVAPRFRQKRPRPPKPTTRQGS
jgi:Protein of unknown function (DUF2627).